MTLTTPLSIAAKTVSTITPRYTDDPQAKVVTMSSPGMLRALILWSETDYTNIGQWTDTQAEAQIQNLAASGALAACFAP